MASVKPEVNQAWITDKGSSVMDKESFAAKRETDDIIVLSKDDWWKYTMNTTALIGCVIGCCFQTLLFAKLYLQYDVTTDVIREYTNHFTFPAVTICNNNKVRKSKVCDYFPQYCTEGKTEINYEGEMDIIFTSSHDALKDMAHKKDSLVRACTTSSEDNHQLDQRICWRNSTRTSIYGVNCVVINDQQVAPYTDPVQMPVFEYLFVTLNFEPQEYVNGTSNGVGANIAVHNPKDTTNCQTFGYFVKPGHTYLIRLSETKHVALPSPYRSKCKNYTEEWLRNGRKGPRTQYACMQMQSLNASMEYCNCYSSQIALTDKQMKDKCTWNSTVEFTQTCIKKFTDVFVNHNLKTGECKPDCELELFNYEVIPDPVITGKFHKKIGKALKNPNFTTTMAILMIGYDVNLMTKTVQSPRIESVEILSYIGGYIGAWLGFSMLQVLQFVPTLIIFLRRWHRKRHK